MEPQTDKKYDMARQAELLQEFDQEVERWRLVLAPQYGSDFTQRVLWESREQYQSLLPHVPYIGGADNHLTSSLIGSVQCLALYRAMKTYGHTAAETGKVLYDAILARRHEPSTPISPAPSLTPEQLMERRRQRAAQSQERRYADDYVYAFVAGDGEAFDYGYDFSECAAQKFYRAEGAEEFLPCYCFLDYAWSQVLGLGLSRSTALSEGDAQCTHRFKRGRETLVQWPP
jgi:hypothetical protein